VCRRMKSVLGHFEKVNKFENKLIQEPVRALIDQSLNSAA